MANFLDSALPARASLDRRAIVAGLPAAETTPFALSEKQRLPLRERLSALAISAFRRSIAVIVLLGIWQALPSLGILNSTFLPPFSRVMVAWWGLVLNGQLLTDLDASLYRILVGFGIAILIAIPLGLLIAWYRPLNELLNPVLEIFRNTAPLALLPVLILVLGIGQTSKIVLVVYSCTWPILLNTISGVRNVDPLLVKAARSMGLSPFRMFEKVVIPAALPTIFTGIRLAGSHAVLVIIAAELIGANAGLGFLVAYAQENYDIPTMYAAIISISALGLIFNKTLLLIERHFSGWKAAAYA